MLNGEPATLGSPVNPTKDKILIDDKPLRAPKKFTYLMLNKPTGYTTTKSDPYAEKTIYDLLPAEYHHLHPVGRLDRESEGLLLLTDDGDFTYSMTHPRNDSQKTYEVKIKTPLSDEQIQKLEKGITIQEETGPYKTKPCRIIKLGNKLSVTLKEGRNRQIRKMFQAAGTRVVFLKRIKMGKYELGDLKKGDYKLVHD